MTRDTLRFGAYRSIYGVLALVVLTLTVPSSAVHGLAVVQPQLELAAVVAAVQRGKCQSQLPALQSLSDQLGPPGARAAYLQAYCLEQTGQIPDAIAAYDAVAARYLSLASYARYAAARLAIGTEATVGSGFRNLPVAADAIDRLGEVIARRPSSALARRARLPYAEMLLTVDRPAEASKVLGDILRGSPEDAILTRAWWLLGVANERLGEIAKAQHAYVMAWWAVPDSSFAPQAMERLKALGDGVLPYPPPEARLERGKRLASFSKISEAEAEFVAVLSQSPPPLIAAEAWYHLAMVRFPSKGTVSALEQALRYSVNAGRNTFWLGEALAAVGRSAEAKAAWRRVSREHPGSLWAARSLFSLAISAEAERAWGETDRILMEIAARFPGWRIGDEARWRRGWLKYRRGRYAEAEAAFLAAVQAAPGSSRAGEALYWAAKAREQQRRDARPLLSQVAQRYPLTYVGQRARQRLGTPPPPRTQPPSALLLRDDRFHPMHEELAALGFDREAADEAEGLLESAPTLEVRRFVATHRALAGDFRASVATAEVAIEPALHGGGAADVGLWALAYPRAYWEQVNALALSAGVDPYLVLAVMREESRYDPQAISPAGAIGLMQVMPFTARALEGGEVPVQKLMQPEVNIRYGATFLGGVLKEFRGDVTLALAAYNAGPMAARRFARASRTDPDLFIANIPYLETRGYVQIVLETYGIYQWLYK